MAINPRLLPLLRCPQTKEPLVPRAGHLENRSGTCRYRSSGLGIPLFAEAPQSAESRQQQEHYDRVSAKYLENLAYPHTQEYFGYLDRALFQHIDTGKLGTALEVCCGRGEAMALLQDRLELGVGLDISLGMLEAGRPKLPADRIALLQGDATCLPFIDNAFDHVFTLGGIHHVPDRPKFFAEIFRVLKPGGRFIWREPVSDFLPWRAIRAVVYRLSPALDAQTEHPLRFHETVPVLETAGFNIAGWRTYGFFGFCLFMNSDVLVFNRLFRVLPGIRLLTRLFTRLDDLITARSWFRKIGLQVIGVAQKPQAGDARQPLAA